LKKEIHENRDKKALVIDQRWNGGGNIEQELLAILVQKNTRSGVPRHPTKTAVRSPVISDRKWCFRTGEIGVPTRKCSRRVHGAGARQDGRNADHGRGDRHRQLTRLIDGSTVRTPQVGVYLADSKHTNMEGYGVQPTIRVENSPEDNLNAKDRQLEAAVTELLKELGN